jgi:hypothetical protein
VNDKCPEGYRLVNTAFESEAVIDMPWQQASTHIHAACTTLPYPNADPKDPFEDYTFIVDAPWPGNPTPPVPCQQPGYKYDGHACVWDLDTQIAHDYPTSGTDTPSQKALQELAPVQPGPLQH